MIKISRQNNFDLIRLFAALQVAILHTKEHLKINSSNNLWNVFLECIRPFQGVPIFFAISGFLIFASYDNNPSAKKYFKNRYLRIYPLLYAITIITTILLIVFATNPISFKSLITWFVGQVTWFQYYTPGGLRYFGAGTPNGSLWTIPVELEFYLLVPLLYYLNKKFGNITLVTLALCSFIAYTFIPHSSLPIVYKKLFETSILYYLLHFTVGIFLYLYFNKIKNIIVNKGLIWLGAYIVFFLVFDKYAGLYHSLYSPSLVGVIADIILSMAILSLAYTKPGLSHKILKGNDYSYGLYVVHMVVVNVMIELLLMHNFWFLIISLVVTFLMAFLSWHYVEKPALALKNKSFGLKAW
jgi:peptidoglycan/LPS O-acetylase OafA/YrhL